MALAEAARDLERAGERHAVLQGAKRCRLDGRSVRHRIGEGHAKLDDVDIGFDKRVENLCRRALVRVACGHEDAEDAAPFGFGIGKGGLDT